MSGFEDSYLGRPLPQSFRAFLQLYNGGAPYDGSLLLDVIGRTVVIERFLPLLNNSLNHSDGWADMGVVVTQIGDRLGIDDTDFHFLAPIAALFAGDFLVLDYRVDAEEPGISLWNHELSQEDTPATDLIANSFSEFIELVRIETS